LGSNKSGVQPLLLPFGLQSLVEQRLGRFLASTLAVINVHVGLYDVRATQTNGLRCSDIEFVKHSVVVRNQHHQVLARIDWLGLQQFFEQRNRRLADVEPGARLTHMRCLHFRRRERRVGRQIAGLRPKLRQRVVECFALQQRKVATSFMAVEAIGVAPRVQQLERFTEANPAVLADIHQRFVAQMPHHLVDQTEAHGWLAFLLNLTLRPAHSGAIGP
jgi:hypothetical protein